MTIYHLLLNRLTLFMIHFSVCSVPSVAKNCVYPCESVSNFPSCLSAFVAKNLCESVKSVVKNQSIKNNNLCETNPIFQKVKCL
jgi:hypothetical protein